MRGNKQRRSKKQQYEFLLDLMRPDGRPEVYDVPPHEGGTGDGYTCFVCDNQGFVLRRYKNPGEVFMTNPLNTPGNKAAFICKEHLPENAVIYDPRTDKCRDKKGENEWKE